MHVVLHSVVEQADQLTLKKTYRMRVNKKQRRMGVQLWLRLEATAIERHGTKIRMSEPAPWHKECGRFNLRVFKNRGNVLYILCNEPDQRVFIFLFYSTTSRYKLIESYCQHFKMKSPFIS